MLDLRAETPKFEANPSHSGDRRRESSRNRDSGRKPDRRERSVQKRDPAARSGTRDVELRQPSQEKALRPSASLTQNRLSSMVQPQRMNASLRAVNKSLSARYPLLSSRPLADRPRSSSTRALPAQSGAPGSARAREAVPAPIPEEQPEERQRRRQTAGPGSSILDLQRENQKLEGLIHDMQRRRDRSQRSLC